MALLVIRLHPSEPITGADFRNALNGVSIDAFEMSSTNPDGVSIGTAIYVAPTFNPSPGPLPLVTFNPTGIVQHFDSQLNPITGDSTRIDFSVGTAVIDIPGGVEYQTADIRLEITRAGGEIIHNQKYYNVPVQPGAIPGPGSFQGISETSLHLPLPVAGLNLDPNDAFVNLPEDGSPPNYESLRQAVLIVLDADPGGIVDVNGEDPADNLVLRGLSLEQCQHIAFEIAWNRTLFPLPEPPRSLEEMYTSPPNDDPDDDEERDRRIFEGDLQGYYALHNATAGKLTQFVFALAAAAWCEVESSNATQVFYRFPVTPGAAPPDGKISETQLILEGVGGGALAPGFTVTTNFFYALGAGLPVQIAGDKRYQIAIIESDDSLTEKLTEAISNGIINAPAGADQTEWQAIRRLTSLYVFNASTVPVYIVTGGSAEQTLIQDWLDHTPQDIDAFWSALNAANEAAHLNLLLRAFNRDADLGQPLPVAVLGTGVTSAVALSGWTENQWRAIVDSGLGGSLGNIPSFISPGSDEERIQAFLRYVRKFFDATGTPTVAPPPASEEIPGLGRPGNPLDTFLANAGGFTFDTWDGTQASIQAALDIVFPGNPEMQIQFTAWLNCIKGMVTLTNGIAPSELQFSVIEALWARGFTSAESISGLSEADFNEALAGSIAYYHAATIWANAGAVAPPDPNPSPENFVPVNPGSLENCVPPAHLSPLGPVAYLKDLLGISTESTCTDPLPYSRVTLAEILANRRGPLGNLAVSDANLSVPLPVVDYVNECLESMVANASAVGVVYDTNEEAVDDHFLSSHPSPHENAALHEPETLFEALPEHSTPATPANQQAAYDILKADFSTPELPYSQAMDINCSYLCEMGTSRYAVARRFRKDITEFVLDPALETPEFQKHLWRYPVRIDTAITYFCLSPEEHEFFTGLGPISTNPLHIFYGFAEETLDGQPWTEVAVKLPDFLKRAGLDYCDFIDLWKSKFVVFRNVGEENDEGELINTEFPECEPCCLNDYEIVFEEPAEAEEALLKLLVFIQLWKKLQGQKNASYTFEQLADIAEVLELFSGGAVNPDFLRQFIAFQMFRDDFDLSLTNGEEPAPGATGADRMHLLAFWQASASQWDWAVEHLLYQIQQYATDYLHCECREPDFVKILKDNLDDLSHLAGFEPDDVAGNAHWHSQPTKTLRFAEILAKIYGSKFTVGELFHLFTADDNLVGDDPFPAQSNNEAQESPLGLPDDEDAHSLFALRKKLMAVEVNDEEASAWTWPQIENTLREEFGYDPAIDGNQLLSLGQHFFPTALEASGIPVSVAERQYRVNLPVTSEGMWNTPVNGPFRYDATAQELWTQLSLTDEAVIGKLSRIRQLSAAEQDAVRDLYFSPRTNLARFSFIFKNFGEAEKNLIEEAYESQRWAWFQRQFDRFYRQCHVISEHMAEYVAVAAEQPNKEGPDLAWLILKNLWADENKALTPWEDNAGAVPNVTWVPQPNGGAFAAILGLCGTGIMAEYFGANENKRWQEVWGGIDAFGQVKNQWNAPVPTVLPYMNLTFTAAQMELAEVRNGFEVANSNGKVLGGAEAFGLHWAGQMLIEETGAYAFRAGDPTPDGEIPNFEKAAHFHEWRVVLRQGQKKWVLLNHEWPNEEAPADCSKAIHLKKGMYQLEIDINRKSQMFDDEEDLCPLTTGFQLKYEGPDSGGTPIVIPFDKLFQQQKDTTLAEGVEVAGEAQNFLNAHYTSTIRDIRRTYQRAAKALLYSSRLGLSAQRVSDDGQSELGFMLAHPVNFAGQSYYRNSLVDPFITHKANFDFNFLPILDNYFPPVAADDQRVAPTSQRTQAMFDWWERAFDYVTMRGEASLSPERPVWLLFHESVEMHPDDPAHLLRHMGVNLAHADIVKKFYPGYVLNEAPHTDDLNDDRWAVRVWKAEGWLRRLKHCFYPADIRGFFLHNPADPDNPTFVRTAPDLWASPDPNLQEAGEPESGNANLTRFFRYGCIENDSPKRYEEIKRLNDGLRLRGRKAMFSYLCAMNRVPLDAIGGEYVGTFATEPKHLGELLLLDVEAGICQKASRIESAVTSVQLFVQRARLGFEPNFPVSSDFILAWDRHFAGFQIWEKCKRREIYSENWIEWEELEMAQQSEAYRFLESEIRRSSLTVPVPGGLAYWEGGRPPRHPGITLLQHREPAVIETLNPAPEGLGLMGTPDRHARPNWLAPLKSKSQITPDPVPGDSNDGPVVLSIIVNGNPEELSSIRTLPLWLKAAVRLGAKFLRIAAASIPPASTYLEPKCKDKPEAVCCEECGKFHPALMDEYYFWIEESECFEGQEQDADWGANGDNLQTDWHRPEELPGLLNWIPKKIIHLRWCRVHNGEFQQPRQSYEGVIVDESVVLSPGQEELSFRGREGDSLYFHCIRGKAPTGYPADPPPGFRYDLVNDEAVVLPLVVAPPADPNLPIGGLSAFPFFAWFDTGAPLLPLSMFSPALTVAGHLRKHCQFEAALKWYELIYDALQNDNSWLKCNKDSDEQNPTDEEDNEMVLALLQSYDCCCASNPVEDAEAKDRAVLMHYLETLLSWGDALMRKHTPEAFQQARLIFGKAAKILGSSPDTILVKKASGGSTTTVNDFQPDCAPLNPRLLCLYCSVGDRLSLIHACMNGRRLKNGRPNLDMPYFGNSDIRECWKTPHQVCEDENDWCLPQSPYRFMVLIQKAQAIAGEVRGLGAALLSAFEKGDGEYLATMRATHERQMLNLALEIRQHQWREADWQVQALQKSKEITITRRQYYADLIANGLKSGEIQFEAKTNASMAFRLSGNISETGAGIMGIIPDMYVGYPVTQTHIPLGLKLAEASLMTVARVMNALAELSSTSGNLDLTKAGWERREEEWQHQVEVLDIEIQQVERQILAAERRRAIALRELNNHQQQIENVGEVHDFLRDKFSNHTLYLWMQQETAALYYQMFELALHCARQAQRAFNFERGHTIRQFLPSGIWDNLHEGLLSGERLQLALQRMEKAYYDEDSREYELTKHISLRLHAPRQLLQLRETGYCEVELPEWLFDLDYPGHYMRRIKNVTLTIPCVVGPYTGVHCRLTLLSSSTRVDPRLCHSKECCDDQGCNNGYEPIADDLRFVKMYAAKEAIATSSGQNDSGMFELNFRDERYLPFEYGGAVSRWRIELPHENNFFDMGTLTDVVMHLNYMAREGGDLLRTAANECAQSHVPGDGVRFFEVKQEMPDAWYLFTQDCDGKKELPVRFTRQMFPYIPGKKDLWTTGFNFFFETHEKCPPNEITIQFKVGPEFIELVEDECDGDTIEIHCVKSQKWPELYHGELSVKIGPIPKNESQIFGTLIFPLNLPDVGSIYVLVGYNLEGNSMNN